jgi:hypothetical protein
MRAEETHVAAGEQDVGEVGDQEARQALGEESGAAPARVELHLGQVTQQWGQVKKACKTRSQKLAALLNDASPVAVLAADLPVVVIRVEYAFHYKQLLEPDSREIMGWALEQILKVTCQMRFLQKSDPIPASTGFVGVPAATGAPLPERVPSAPLAGLAGVSGPVSPALGTSGPYSGALINEAAPATSAMPGNGTAPASGALPSNGMAPGNGAA